VVKGTHVLSLQPPGSALAAVRPLMDAVYNAPVLAFAPLTTTPAAWAATHTTAFTGLANPAGLPVNVGLITMDLLAGRGPALLLWV
jgi:hypothetical protein